MDNALPMTRAANTGDTSDRAGSRATEPAQLHAVLGGVYLLSTVMRRLSIKDKIVVPVASVLTRVGRIAGFVTRTSEKAGRF